MHPGPQVSYTAPCLHWVAAGREQKVKSLSGHDVEVELRFSFSWNNVIQLNSCFKFLFCLSLSLSLSVCDAFHSHKGAVACQYHIDARHTATNLSIISQTDIQSQVLSLTHTGGVGLPGHRYSLSLAGPAVGDEGLAETVFMNRTLTHVRHT